MRNTIRIQYDEYRYVSLFFINSIMSRRRGIPWKDVPGKRGKLGNSFTEGRSWLSESSSTEKGSSFPTLYTCCGSFIPLITNFRYFTGWMHRSNDFIKRMFVVSYLQRESLFLVSTTPVGISFLFQFATHPRAFLLNRDARCIKRIAAMKHS